MATKMFMSLFWATIDEERFFDKELTSIMETALAKVTVS
jgi:hypothetical protein